jgi:exopolysaccharide production protein ExoZ
MLVYIQVLRFLAAFAVVAFHAWGVAPEGYKLPEGWLSFILARSGHGVDLFFVISGFIIFYATHRSAAGAGQFLRRRIERIVPLYYFVTLLVTVLGLTLPEMFGAPDWLTPRQVLKSLAFVAFSDGQMPVVYLGWSLEYEMYFYLAVAGLMLLTRQVWRDVVLLFCALVVIGQIPGLAPTMGAYAFFVDPLILEFVFGVLIGMAFVEGRIGWPVLAALGCALAALLAAEPASRAIVFGLPSAGLVAVAVWASRRRAAPSELELGLARLGDASYSIYLAQVNTISLANKGFAALFPAISPLALILATSTLVVLCGLLLNIVVERPALTLFRRSDLRAPRPAAA